VQNSKPILGIKCGDGVGGNTEFVVGTLSRKENGIQESDEGET
jgi:hypothetical protein